jgi:hypothetical protein
MVNAKLRRIACELYKAAADTAASAVLVDPNSANCRRFCRAFLRFTTSGWQVPLQSANGATARSKSQLTHLSFCEASTGSSSIMYWVLPITPIMRTPVAAYHFLAMLSPVWQPQLRA